MLEVLVVFGLLSSVVEQPEEHADSDELILPKALAGVLAMPERFHGKWSTSTANCDEETGDFSKWLFVGPASIGSFEHMYEYWRVEPKGAMVTFETIFGRAYQMQINRPDRLLYKYSDDVATELVRCPIETASDGS